MAQIDFDKFIFTQFDKTQVNVKEMVIWHLNAMFKALHKRIHARLTFNKRRNGKVCRVMHPEYVTQVYRVFRDLTCKAGLEVNVERYASGEKLKVVEIKFYSRDRFVALMGLFGVDVKKWLVKKLSGGRKAVVLITDEKPFIFKYSYINNTANIIFNYNVTNQGGAVL